MKFRERESGWIWMYFHKEVFWLLSGWRERLFWRLKLRKEGDRNWKKERHRNSKKKEIEIEPFLTKSSSAKMKHINTTNTKSQMETVNFQNTTET